MNKIKLISTLLVLGVTIVNANPVIISSAQNTAANFYKDKYPTVNPNLSLVYTERDANAQPLYYVFNVNTNKGFVIVAAEDGAHPIIGYSNEGPFVAPSSDNNVAFWLQKCKKEVVEIRTKNITATVDIKDEWISYASNTQHKAHNVMSQVLPLCKTAWDQSPYYNANCPGGSITGCVSTAMGQIMKYWAYPSSGKGSNCYEDEISDGFQENYGQLCVVFSSSYYNWTVMTDTVSSSNYSVAKLLYDCGVSVDMDYSPNGSASSSFGSYPSALYSYPHYFKYDSITINSAAYTDYTDANWITLLENELNHRRVMQFGGFDSNTGGGHAWVCDGYNSSNQVHMNWGWSGQDNGYYAVTSLNPDNTDDFNSDIRVIYGIQPPPSALAVNEVADNTGKINVYPNPSHGIFTFEIPNGNRSHQVEVYNVLGQEVCTSTISSENAQINLSAQPKGIYIYKLLTTNGDLISAGRLVVE